MATLPLSTQIYNAAESNTPTSVTPGLNELMAAWVGFQFYTGAGGVAINNQIQAYRSLILEVTT